jgi:hypothetical protein
MTPSTGWQLALNQNQDFRRPPMPCFLTTEFGAAIGPMYQGRPPLKEGIVVGHEIMGAIGGDRRGDDRYRAW